MSYHWFQIINDWFQRLKFCREIVSGFPLSCHWSKQSMITSNHKWHVKSYKLNQLFLARICFVPLVISRWNLKPGFIYLFDVLSVLLVFNLHCNIRFCQQWNLVLVSLMRPWPGFIKGRSYLLKVAIKKYSNRRLVWLMETNTWIPLLAICPLPLGLWMGLCTYPQKEWHFVVSFLFVTIHLLASHSGSFTRFVWPAYCSWRYFDLMDLK